MMCVYLITNLITNKKYIGSSCNYSRRIYKHKSQLKNNNHYNYRLQNDYNEYGEESFVFSPLSIVDKKELLLEEEQRLINKFDVTNPNNGYNISPVVGSSPRSIKRPVLKYSLNGSFISEYESIDDASCSFLKPVSGGGISAACKGKYRFYKGFLWIYKEEFTQELLDKKVNFASIKKYATVETRMKQRAAKLGKKVSEEKKLNHSRKLKGKIPKNLYSIQMARRRPINVYSVSGEFLEKFESVRECKKKHPSCEHQLHGDVINPRNFIFKYENK